MKMLCISLLILLVTACDPYGFGFRDNPAHVLDTAFKAVLNLDLQSFVDVSGKEALCLYGNEKGIQYLKEKQRIDSTNIRPNASVVWKTHHKTAEYRGYWTYYSERYLIEIQDRATDTTVIKTVTDCYYGMDGDKEDRYLGLDPKSYKKRECKVVKIVPTRFEALPMSAKCEVMKVDLDPLKSAVIKRH